MNKFVIYFLVFCSSGLVAQIGGTKGYRFLDLAMPARSNALGGADIAIWDNDINLTYANPALLQPGSSKQLAVNYVNYVADMNFGNFMYGQQLKKYGTLGLGLQFFNYGKFDGRDEYNVETGNFKAADYSFNVSFAKPINKDSTLSIGVALKTLYSHYEAYTSLGSAMDVGLTYHNKKQLVISLVAKNYGRQWSTYTPDAVREKLPFDLKLGISKKVAKAPFRIIAQYDQLLKWDLTYTNPQDANSDIDPFTNKLIEKTKKQLRREKRNKGLDKFGRHLLVGTEVLIGKNFFIRLAFDYRNAKEMALPDMKYLNGLSYGVGLKVYKFHLNYGYCLFSRTGTSHTIGITTNLNYFAKKQ